MSDKHASEKTPTVSLDEISTRESNSAADALFDDFASGAKQLFRGGLQLTERVHDSAAGFFAFGRKDALEDHTKQLEKEAANALKHGDISAAKHFLKRDVAFTLGTQGYDDQDSQRLLSELKQLEALEKQRSKEKQAEAKAVKPPKSVSVADKLADLMLTGS